MAAGFNITVHLKGFNNFGRVINPTRFNNSLKRYIKQANTKSGKLGRRLVKKSIKSNEWTPNSPWTIKKKGHGNTLIEWGIMLNNTGYKHIPWGFEVGTHRVSDDGKYNIARIVHDGAIIKHPQNKSKQMIIPPRPFFTKALFNTTHLGHTVTHKTQSEFMKALVTNWAWAIHFAFVSGGKPTKQKMPK